MTTRARDISPRSLRIVATHSAIAGLCPLIPVPYVDDMLIRRVSWRMSEALFEAHGHTLTRASAKALTAKPSEWLRGAATSAALFPIRKALKKIVYVLAIKDCADVASAVFHDGWLLARLLERGPESGLSLDDPRTLKRVRTMMLRTYKEIDPAPLRRALVGAFLGAKVGAREAAQAVQRRRGDAAHSPAVEGLAARMRAAAMTQWQYLDALEQRFHKHLGLAAPQLAATESTAQA